MERTRPETFFRPDGAEGKAVNDPNHPTPPGSVVTLLAQQRQDWRCGRRAPVEQYLAQSNGLRPSDDELLDLIYNEMMLREESGELPRLEEYLGRFPTLAGPL